jgi:small-conductance mechanosensitive channel
MRIWDKRRLIIPVNYFLEKPFQNWSRSSTDLLGTIFLYTDYQIPITELTKELSQIVKNSLLWDGVVSLIQMTDVKSNMVELRILVSALNSSDLFNLRCIVREKLIDYIVRNYPQYLPKSRFSFTPENNFI